MRKWAKGAAGATLLTASFVALGAVPALADVTNGNESVLGGNQVNAPISVPINVSGNAVGVLGHALAGSTGGSSVSGLRRGGGSGSDYTSGRHSIGGGNQIHAPINVPINACGNSAAILGGALAGCQGGAAVHGLGGYAGAGHRHTSGRHSILGGNQVDAPVNAPVNICGNAAAVIGDALAGCKGGAGVHGAAAGGGHYGYTSGHGSVAGGNQVHLPVNAPINACGNAIGNAIAGCQGGAFIHGGHHGGYHGGYQGGYHGGYQGGYPVGNTCGSAIPTCQGGGFVPGGLVPGGDPGAYQGGHPVGNACGSPIADCQGGGVHGGYPAGYVGRGNHTSGAFSILGGNQIHAPINVPIDVCGNAAAIVGHALSGCAGALPGAPAYYGVGHHNHTSGIGSIGGGNQIYAPINVPVDICGNGIAIVGRALGGCGVGTGVGYGGGAPIGYGGGHPGGYVGGYPGGYAGAPEDCPPWALQSNRMSGLPQLPATKSLGTGALPVAMGATPALPKLPVGGLGDSVKPQSADASNPVGGLGLPLVGGPPKQLPPLNLAAAESSTASQNGALMALALGGMFAASAGAVSVARRLRRR
ncbi:chaplin family protein [Actinomadura sp. DC4]|uniref:chaplin family protein n=1 Tax=Actinomadura sp. DC4 TaxID=3055069 RepID=UPI0025B20DD0|nr:chaplin family protein [Actinomadura sp. DC4]MDN3359271.1 chaplin family protein [Actinomadura sp. DC4]